MGLVGRQLSDDIIQYPRCVKDCRSGGMADALDSKSSGLRAVWVQLPPPVLRFFGLGVFSGRFVVLSQHSIRRAF